MRTLLAVDDEYDMVDALRLLLEDEGYRVVTATNGEEALARLAEVRPDVALVDVMMPRMGGRALLQAMRDNPAWRTIPVIVMSAAPRALTDEEREKIPFLQKPFSLHGLLQLLDDLLGERRA